MKIVWKEVINIIYKYFSIYYRIYFISVCCYFISDQNYDSFWSLHFLFWRYLIASILHSFITFWTFILFLLPFLNMILQMFLSVLIAHFMLNISRLFVIFRHILWFDIFEFIFLIIFFCSLNIAPFNIKMIKSALHELNMNLNLHEFTWNTRFTIINTFTNHFNNNCINRAFSHDITAAMLVYQNKGTATILVYQANPLGIELFFSANTFFCFIKPIWQLVTWVKTLCTKMLFYCIQTIVICDLFCILVNDFHIFPILTIIFCTRKNYDFLFHIFESQVEDYKDDYLFFFLVGMDYCFIFQVSYH